MNFSPRPIVTRVWKSVFYSRLFPKIFTTFLHFCLCSNYFDRNTTTPTPVELRKMVKLLISNICTDIFLLNMLSLANPYPELLAKTECSLMEYLRDLQRNNLLRPPFFTMANLFKKSKILNRFRWVHVKYNQLADRLQKSAQKACTWVFRARRRFLEE